MGRILVGFLALFTILLQDLDLVFQKCISSISHPLDKLKDLSIDFFKKDSAEMARIFPNLITCDFLREIYSETYVIQCTQRIDGTLCSGG